MLQQNFVSNDYRAALHKFVDHLQGNGSAYGLAAPVTMENAVIAPYTIRMHTSLKAGTNSYDFDLKNGIAPLAIEKRLADSDIFQAFGMSLSLQQYDPAAADFSKPLWTHPDATAFGTGAPCCELIYAGNTTFNTDGTNRIQNFDNSLFRFAPGGNLVYGSSFEERGYYLFAGYPIILGNKVNKITVNLAPGATTNIPGTGAASNNLVVLIHGFRFTGVNNGGACQA